MLILVRCRAHPHFKYITSALSCKSGLYSCFTITLHRFVLGLGHLLVAEGVFKKIKINFLPVGHTHNDVDQMFSALAGRLRYANLLSLADISAACEGAYSGKLTFIHLDQMASWSTLLNPLLPKNMTGHAKYPRCFVIRRDTKGVVRHKYRIQVQTSRKDDQDCWMPVNTPGYCLLPVLPDLSQLRTVPFKEVDVKPLQQTLKYISAYCSEEQRTWWESVLRQFEEEDADTCGVCKTLRQVQRDNASNHSDSKDIAREKRKAWAQSREDMFVHLQARGFPAHGFFDGPMLPEDRLHGGPVPVVEPFVSADPLVEEMGAVLQEGNHCHFIDGSGANSREKLRPKEIQVGMICIIRGDEQKDEGKAAEDGAGGAGNASAEVHDADDEAEEPDGASFIEVHEMANKEGQVMKGSKQEYYYHNSNDDRGMYCKKRGAQSKGFKPLLRKVKMATIVDYGSVKDMLYTDNSVRKKVLEAIDQNERVDWNLVDPKIVDEDKQYPWFVGYVTSLCQ